jgi:hypothetical protein
MSFGMLVSLLCSVCRSDKEPLKLHRDGEVKNAKNWLLEMFKATVDSDG